MALVTLAIPIIRLLPADLKGLIMAAELEDDRPGTGTYYGMPFFHYDLVAKVVPGLVCVWSSWYILMDEALAVSAWNGVMASVLMQCSPLVAAYAIGSFLDSFNWLPIEMIARLLWRCEKRQGLPRSWKLAFRRMTAIGTKGEYGPEFKMMEKAHVEARGLFSVGTVLLLTLVVSIVFHRMGIRSLACKAAQGCIEWVYVPLIVFGPLAMFGAMLRERRRVIGASILLIGAIAESDRPKQSAAVSGETASQAVVPMTAQAKN